MAFVNCVNGHIYDNVKFRECPFCHSSEGEHAASPIGLDSEDEFSAKTIVDDGLPQTDPADTFNAAPAADIPETIPDKTMAVEVPDQPDAVIQKASSAPASRIEGFLVTYSHNKYGQFYPLYLGKNRIGRDSKNDIVVDDLSMSGEHAIILFRGKQVFIEDRLSVNGTFLNDGEESIDRERLKDNDIIRMGKTTFKIKIIGDAPDKESN